VSGARLFFFVFCAYFWAGFAFESGWSAEKGQLLGPKKFGGAGKLHAGRKRRLFENDAAPHNGCRRKE
jgi:hypothetical protein